LRRTIVGLLFAVSLLWGGAPALAQSAGGSGKLEFTIVPAGWVSVTEPDTQPEPAFGQYFFGGTFTVNWSRLGLEG
jgi:hypothetical protein